MTGFPKPCLNLARNRILPNQPGDRGYGEETEQQPLKPSQRKSQVVEYRPIALVGKGSFGKVMLARNLDGEREEDPVAVKVLSKLDVLRRSHCDRIRTEARCLELCDSPFIPKLYGCFQTTLHLYIIQEFIQGGELYFHLEKHNKVDQRTAKFIIAECLLGMHYLHSQGIMYRDFKPENIMFDAEGHVKLVDFGLSKILDRKAFFCDAGALSFVGTSEYLSPEMILRDGHGYGVDFWAVGMVLYEMLSGLPPWYCEDQNKVKQAILARDVPFKKMLKNNSFSILFDYHTRSFISSLLEKRAQHRLGCSQTVPHDVAFMDLEIHPYFSEDPLFDWKTIRNGNEVSPLHFKFQSATDTACFDPTLAREEQNIQDSLSAAAQDAEFLSWEEPDQQLLLSSKDNACFRGFSAVQFVF